MQYIAVKTRILQPPKDDLFSVLEESLHGVEEGDIIAISSKVVAIHEGACILKDETDKNELMLQEAEVTIPRSYAKKPLTIKHSAFISVAGIDESNANGYLVMLPKNPFESAYAIQQYIKKRFKLENIGVLIVDSHSSPLRRGATGVSIGFWGFHPTIHHVGKPDLFGRLFQREVTNVADALAAGANLVMGETDECQPIVLIKGATVSFTEENTKDELFVPFERDTFRVLYEDFLT